MKTLVLQLARLGDIYQTWPVVRALKRTGATEIHMLAREKFIVATDGLDEIDKVWAFDTKDVLAPLIADTQDIDASLECLERTVNLLRAEGFERVINLTFSPFSSRLTSELAAGGVEVRGYTRHTDGYLRIVDDAAAYFYAQVGPDRENRVHLTELFAQVAGVELINSDWAKPTRFTNPISQNSELLAVLGGVEAPVVIHLGASQSGKTFGTHKWLQVVTGLLEKTAHPVVLIGSQDETELAAAVQTSASGREAVNFVGRTNLRDVFALMEKAKIAIGGDSAPVHIASLVGTPYLNLSFRTVSFWETGPKSTGSRILPFDTADDLPSDVVVRDALAMITGNGGDSRSVQVTGPVEPFVAPSELATSHGWEWLQAIYMGQPFPVPESELCMQGLVRLHEANELALEQLAILERRAGDRTALGILDRFDEIIETIARMVPTLGILVRWFETERIRFGPMPGPELLSRTKALHAKLQDVLNLYVAGQTEGEVHDDVCVG